jgi:tetratricopeptide (TPR) repeat protein
LSPVTLGSYAIALAVAHVADSSIATARRAVELDSNMVSTRHILGAVYLQTGHLADGLRELQLAARLDSTSARGTGLLGYAYAKSGLKATALALAAGLERDLGRRSGAASAAARIYIGLGDNARAVALLERAVADHDAFFSSESFSESFFDPVRGDTRVAAIVARAGLTTTVPPAASANPASVRPKV